MSPLVTVIVPCTETPGAAEARAVDRVRAQTLGDWELLLAGGDALPDGTRGDPRITHVPTGSGASRSARINAGIDRARGRYLTILDPRDDLAPGALDALAAGAGRARGCTGAVGGWRFTCPIGDVPGDPMDGLPGELGFDELLGCAAFPGHAQVVRWDAIGSQRLREGPEERGEYGLFLRLAAAGVRWARVPEVVARVAVGGVEPATGERDGLGRGSSAAIGAAVGARLAVVRDAHDEAVRRGTAGPGTPPVREAARPYLEALVVLREWEERWRGREAGLAEQVWFPGLYAQWWHRLGWMGRPPRHVLTAHGGGLAGGLEAAPELIAARMLASCEPGQPVELLGLGRNACRVARLMASLGVPVRGRDDGLRGPPAWALAEGLDVQVVPADTPFDPRTLYLMTVGNDEAYLRRLPSGLSVLRWSRMPALLVGEWIETLSMTGPDGAGAWRPSVAETGLLRLPSMVAERLVDACDLSRPVVLEGLARHGELVARALAARGVRDIAGRDAALREPPRWAREHGLAVRVLPDSTPLPQRTQLIVTPMADAYLEDRLARLHRADVVLRWRDALGALLAGGGPDARAVTPSASGTIEPAPARLAGAAA